MKHNNGMVCNSSQEDGGFKLARICLQLSQFLTFPTQNAIIAPAIKTPNLN